MITQSTYSFFLVLSILQGSEAVLSEREQVSLKSSSSEQGDGAPWSHPSLTPKKFPADLLLPGHSKELQAAMLSGRAGCHPGTATPPRFKHNHVPYTAHDPEKQKLGDRVLASLAVDPELLRKCEGFTMFGDYAWCAKAMPKLLLGATNQAFGFTEVGNVNLSGRPDGSDFLALSYGIRERDMWSELLSNRYRIPSEVFDCFTKLDVGPMGSKNLLNPFLGEELCPPWNIEPCYDAPYKVHRSCIGNSSFVMHSDRDLEFVTLGSSLVGRKPLSTYVKMDVEGSEWDVLDQLVKNEEDCKKIVTLDMEVHLNKYFDGTRYLGPAQLERKVEIMEALARRFRVVGSTVQSLHKGRMENMQRDLDRNPKKTYNEPLIYPTDGLDIGQFALSYVNPDFFD